ncbi:type II secretion protein [archaeon]|nr:type II secretion protein [archaeon]
MVAIESYKFYSENIPIYVRIRTKPDEFVRVYELSIPNLSPNTELILNKIKDLLVDEVNLDMADLTDPKKKDRIREKFESQVKIKISQFFPTVSPSAASFFKTYLIQKSLGMGKVEILLDDSNLEEIAINNAAEPIWVYHHKHGWLKTNIQLKDEAQIRHYSNLIGRQVGRAITVLKPLMDAHLETGDRVNATISPISKRGNTITLRKFASKPWTIVDFLSEGTISLPLAALVWMACQYEMSLLVSGGTASGKTSALNAISGFFPPNQRIISIEDTLELRLPKFLHWVPMVVRFPNTEGKGEVSMLDLMINSLRMRPDRIVVGEIRREREAQVLFESIHTGHAVYATVHADNTAELITRLTSPPINVPVLMLPAIAGILVMYRNRRTGIRRMLEFAEVDERGGAHVLFKLDTRTNKINAVAQSNTLIKRLALHTGMSLPELSNDLAEKEIVLHWLVKNRVNTVDAVGRVIAAYYANKKALLNKIKSPQEHPQKTQQKPSVPR